MSVSAHTARATVPPAPAQPPATDSAPGVKHRLLPGVVSGLFTAALFNPWDRALFLSVMHNRPFLVVENFRGPFQGLAQTLMHRTISNGLYFVLQDATYDALCHSMRVSRTDTNVVALAGLLAGAANGACLNVIAAVKYQGWAVVGPGDKFSFLHTSRTMWRGGGVAPFLKGTRTTIVRDASFGVVYEVIRHSPWLIARLGGTELNHMHLTASMQFNLNLGAAICATVVSSPFNYVRNIQYASSPAAAPTTIWSELRAFAHEVRGSAAPWQAVQRRLRLGWGSLRVGVGMAVGTKVYELTQHGLR